jgi:uncharacterized membrane protein HdeD (DUF308 family)
MDLEMQDLQMYWWALTFRGIAAVLFGIAAVFWPHITLVILLYIFSAWILVDGIIRIVTGVSRLGRHQLAFLPMVVGLLQLGVGIYLLRHPGVSFDTLILLIGFMLIVAGVIEAVASLTSPDSVTARTLSVIIGAAAVIAGVVLLFQPSSAGVAFVWILGLYALIAGPVMIAMSVDVHRLAMGLAARKR